jgi:hypothetical protein
LYTHTHTHTHTQHLSKAAPYFVSSLQLRLLFVSSVLMSDACTHTHTHTHTRTRARTHTQTSGLDVGRLPPHAHAPTKGHKSAKTAAGALWQPGGCAGPGTLWLDVPQGAVIGLAGPGVRLSACAFHADMYAYMKHTSQSYAHKKSSLTPSAQRYHGTRPPNSPHGPTERGAVQDAVSRVSAKSRLGEVMRRVRDRSARPALEPQTPSPAVRGAHAVIEPCEAETGKGVWDMGVESIKVYLFRVGLLLIFRSSCFCLACALGYWPLNKCSRSLFVAACCRDAEACKVKLGRDLGSISLKPKP